MEEEDTGDDADGDGLEAEGLVEIAENLIGLDEAAENDPLQHYIVIQQQVRRVQEEQEKVQRKEARVQRAKGEDILAAETAKVAAEETCKSYALDLRDVCRRLSARHEKAVEEELALLERGNAGSDKVLVVRAGQMLSMFAPESWTLCFTEFFFGDCLPFDRSRPVRVEPAVVMELLLQREELEYSLQSDERPYVACPTSRWDNPEVVAMFADTLRREKLLLSTKMTFLGSSAFKQDLRVIAQATAEDFADLTKYSTLGQAYTSSKTPDRPAMKALKHLLTSTASVPLTEGNKMKLRHYGHAMDMNFGALKLFMTCNFADTYMPLTLTLYDPDNKQQLLTQRMTLLQERPSLPTLREMHRVVAESPETQAQLFLLLEEIVLTELLCVQDAFIGRYRMFSSEMPEALRRAREDHFASNTVAGLADFAEALLIPLEAQGRGFAHGHAKVLGVPSTSAHRLKQIFHKDAGMLQSVLEEMRRQIVDAVCTIQYDCATLPAEQLGVSVIPEPVSKAQQRASRLDGGMEENGEQRPRLEITEPEPPGHIAEEARKAAVERRPPKHGYKEVPLTGCHQSVMPLYRLFGSFGRIAAPDERGLYSEGREVDTRRFLVGAELPWRTDEKGRVLGYNLPNGQAADGTALDDDARAWSLAYARDVRSVFCQNHDHNCVATCAKYAKKTPTGNQGETESGPRRRRRLDPREFCRFLFVRVVEVSVGGKVKRYLRRGKELVSKVCACVTNVRNEYGKVCPIRRHPFRSTSSDIGQAFARCNMDVQRNDRVVVGDMDAPMPSDAAAKAATLQPVRCFYGNAVLTPGSQRLLAALAEGLRSSHVCDFYMTKYLAKGQQVLASAVSPVLLGLRRLDEEIAAGTRVVPTELDVARAKLRRILFSANRAHWFSACELAIFVLTGGHSISTHVDRPCFMGRIVYMLEEGKRLRNGNWAGQFVEQADVGARDSVEVVAWSLPEQAAELSRVLPPRGQKRKEPGDVLGGHEEEGCDAGGAAEEEADNDAESAVEHAAAVDAEGDAVEHPASARGEVDASGAEASSVPIFKATVSSYDDWLHRGYFLQPFDFHSYLAYVDTVPRTEDTSIQGFLFEPHYPKHKLSWQKLSGRTAVPRIVGSSCPRMDAAEGEENSRYKLCLFGLSRCASSGACSDPIARSRAYLWPTRAAGDVGLVPVSFRMAWKARRAHLEVEADRARRKIAMSRKHPVLLDCTTFRWAATAQPSLLVILVQQLLYGAMRDWCDTDADTKHIETLLFAFLGTGVYAREQLHLSEYIALRACDALLRLDMHTEARNTAVLQAKTKMETNVEDDAASVPEDEENVLVDVENVGGEPGDMEEEGVAAEPVEVVGVDVSTSLSRSVDSVRRQLFHVDALAAAKERGTRVPDAVRFLLQGERSLKDVISQSEETYCVRSVPLWSPDEPLEQLFEAQRRAAEALRREDPLFEEASADVPELFQGSVPPEGDVRLEDAVERGPAAAAKVLCEAAGLNADQRAFVALLASRMQRQFDALPPSAQGRLPKDTVIFRGLLVGGGGCGKTRIINQVLRPLLTSFYGAGGVQTQAASNKAARLIGGKTMHTANKLRAESSLRTVYLRLTAETRRALEASASRLGALIIDEFSQCIAQPLGSSLYSCFFVSLLVVFHVGFNCFLSERNRL